MSDPRSDVVAGQYETWVYPEPIEDLPGWLKNNWQWFDPSHAHGILWPDRGYPPSLNILVAGCGTSQAAVLAYTNPSARIVGIDVSTASLAHHESLKQRYGLRNLELHHLPIEEVGRLGCEFDLIISTGVLHHLADPQAGMDALTACLAREGVMALMLYARYGRAGVEIMESVFQELGLRQDEASLAVVKDALAVLPEGHPLKSYLEIAWDTDFDAGLVDTFLHGRAISYTVQDCLDLVANAGLVFQEWLHKSQYEPMRNSGNIFLETVAPLPDAQRWSLMERINTRNGCHFFMACRADRPQEQYRIDAASPAFASLVPAFRHQSGLDGEAIVKPGWREPLNPAYLGLVAAIDGRRTIADIADIADNATAVSPATAVDFFRTLWQLDYVSMGIRRHN